MYTPAGGTYLAATRLSLITTHPCRALRLFVAGTQNACPALAAITGPRSTISPHSTYSHRPPPPRGPEVSGGQCSNSLVPAIGMTLISGPGTVASRVPGFAQ